MLMEMFFLGRRGGGVVTVVWEEVCEELGDPVGLGEGQDVCSPGD